MTESARWKSVKPDLEPFGRFVRIENRADLGTPDVFYTLRRLRDSHDRQSGWLELKFLERAPRNPETVVKLKKLTLEQVTWIEEEHMAGGCVNLLLFAGKSRFLFDAEATRMLYEGRWTVRDLMAANATPGMLVCRVETTAELIRCLRR